MAEIPLPELDSRNESAVVAGVIDDLPAEFSDRNAGAAIVKLVEGVGAYYGLILFALNQWGERLRLYVLRMLGIELEAATFATVTLRFSRVSTSGAVNVPSGTIVKTGTGLDAIRFATDALGSMADGVGFVDVAATAVIAGSAGNVPTGSLVLFDSPVSGVDSVTNAAAATGGQDLETVAAAEARAPLTVRAADRAITADDFEAHALTVADVERALAVSEYNGQVLTYVLAGSDLNETPNGTLTATVQALLESKTIPGLLVEVEQPSVTLVMVTEVEVELEAGYTVGDVSGAIETALSRFFSAVDVVDADGVTLLSPAWTWGRSVTENELVALLAARRSPTGALLAGVAGVRRVGAIEVQTSTDYGAGWSAAAPLTTITPNAVWGLLHWGDGYGSHDVFSVVAL